MSPLAFAFVLVDLWLSAWLLWEVVGFLRRNGGAVVGHHRAGAVVLAAVGAFGRLGLAVGTVLSAAPVSPDSDWTAWVSAEHLTSAALVLAVGMMVRGGFRLSDRARSKPPESPMYRPKNGALRASNGRG